jgi:hypothetical protein
MYSKVNVPRTSRHIARSIRTRHGYGTYIHAICMHYMYIVCRVYILYTRHTQRAYARAHRTSLGRVREHASTGGVSRDRSTTKATPILSPRHAKDTR